MLKFSLSLLIIGFSSSIYAISGQELAQKVFDSNRNAYQVQKVKMTLTDKSNNKSEREMVIISTDKNKFDSQFLIVFNEPRKFKNTAFLTHNKKSDNSDQWLYLPALKKSRRISSSNKGGRFVNSDLTYQDLESRSPDMDNHKILKESKKDQKYMLESIPKKASSSIYDRSVAIISAKDYTILKSNHYKNGKLIKTVENTNFKKVGNAIVPHKSLVKDLKLNHQTLTEVLKTNNPTNLPSYIFEPNILTNLSRVQAYLK